MKIDKILSGLRENMTTPKSAAPAAAAVTKTAAPNALVSAMHEAIASAPSVKTASVAQPVDDVMKIASDLANAENEAMVKQAQVMAAAFADTVVTRLDEWRKVASAMPVEPYQGMKIASTGDHEFDKFAAENPDVIGQAHAAGYPINRAGLEKMADDSYVEGYNDTVVAIHKTAAMEFLKGAAVCAQVLQAAAAQ